jgi:hypothetical protein
VWRLKGAVFLITIQASASLIQQLAAALQREDKNDKIVNERLQEMASLLLFLLKHHYARANIGQASAKGKEKEGTSSECRRPTWPLKCN